MAEKKWNDTGKVNKANYIEARTGGKCQGCHEVWPVEVMQFHHLDPSDKENELNADKWRGMLGPPQKTLDEADKCVILCGNCHDIEHIALRKGETTLNDQETHSRFRSKRFATFKNMDGRDLRSPDKGDCQLSLSFEDTGATGALE